MEQETYGHINFETFNTDSTDDFLFNTLNSFNEPQSPPPLIEQISFVTDPIFELKYVEMTGNDQKGTLLVNNDKPLDLKDKQCIAICWTEKNKEKYFNSTQDKDCEIHESCNIQITNDKITLNQCLDLFTSQEQLGIKDTWYCPECSDHMQAFKKFDIWNLPPILVIHLKRFSYGKGIYDFREKLDDLVEFPTDLDLTGKIKSCDPNTLVSYELYAVSNHYGNLGTGHYTAYAKLRNGEWFEYDDRRVSPINSSTIASEAAYVLFFKKKDFVFQPFNEEWDQKSESETDSGEASDDPGSGGGDNLNSTLYGNDNSLNQEETKYLSDEMNLSSY